MMKHLRNEKGIALVTAMLLSLISLAMVLTVIYFVTQSTRITAIQKRYQTALEASQGGVEFITKAIIPKTISLTVADLSIDTIESTYSMIGMDVQASALCLSDKLHKSTLNWDGGCSSTLDPKSAPDMKFSLSGIPPAPNFDVYVKIVDAVKGNSDTSGLELAGFGVVESGSGLVVPQHRPYLYRVEVQGERQDSPEERANLSVLYGF